VCRAFAAHAAAAERVDRSDIARRRSIPGIRNTFGSTVFHVQGLGTPRPPKVSRTAAALRTYYSGQVMAVVRSSAFGLRVAAHSWLKQRQDFMRRVFLSSTGRDLSQHRQAVAEAIQRLDDHHCVRMEDFGARPESALEVCRREVAKCDVLVLIAGLMYGSSPPGYAESFTLLEFETARRLRKPCLVFLAPDNLELLSHLREDEQQMAKQLEFRARLRREFVVMMFSSETDLATAVAQALFNHERPKVTPRSRRLGWGLALSALVIALTLVVGWSALGSRPQIAAEWLRADHVGLEQVDRGAVLELKQDREADGEKRLDGWPAWLSMHGAAKTDPEGARDQLYWFLRLRNEAVSPAKLVIRVRVAGLVEQEIEVRELPPRKEVLLPVSVSGLHTDLVRTRNREVISVRAVAAGPFSRPSDVAVKKQSEVALRSEGTPGVMLGYPFDPYEPVASPSVLPGGGRNNE
jgi:hypothetical protein